MNELTYEMMDIIQAEASKTYQKYKPGCIRGQMLTMYDSCMTHMTHVIII